MSEEQNIDSSTSEAPANLIADAPISTWITRFEASEKYMKDEFLPKYKLARERLRADYQVETDKGGHKTHKQVNLTYSIGSNFVNSIAPRKIDINFTARNDEETEKVENTEIKVNDFFKDKKVKKDVKRLCWDAYNGGFGARFLDYEYEAKDDQESPLMDAQKQPMGFKQIVLKNDHILKRIRPELVRFPEGFDFDNFQDSPWIGFDCLIPVVQLKDYPQYDINATQKIKGKQYQSVTEEKSRKNSKSDLLYAKLHYVFIKTGDDVQMTVISDEVKDLPVQKMTSFDKGQDGYPIKFLYFNPLDDDNSYPSGDPWLCESQLNAVDKWFKTFFNHTRRNNPKNLINSSNIKDPVKFKQKLKNNEDMEYVDVEMKNGVAIESATTPFEQPRIPPEISQFYEISRSILDEIAPKSSLSRGNEQSKDQKLGVAQIIQANEMIDIEARQDDVKEFILDIALDLAGMMEQSQQGMVQVSGKLSSGKEVNREVDKSGFTSEFANKDCDIEAIKPFSRDIKRRQLLEFIAQLQTLEPLLNKQGKSIDYVFFIKKFFELIEIRGVDKALIDLNLKDPSKETIDAVFSQIPMQVQDGEDKKAHLLDHYGTFNDKKKMAVFEQIAPGFTDHFTGHILDTSEKLKAEEGQAQPKPMKPIPTSDKMTGSVA